MTTRLAAQFDIVMWAAGLLAAAVTTLVAIAAGARLGAGLSGGAIVLVAVVAGALGWQSTHAPAGGATRR